MRNSIRVAVAAAVAVFAHPAYAQKDAEAVIEKSLSALGGRAAHSKIQSRHATGTVAISTPVGEIAGTIELLNAPPNKTRVLIKADLSAMGGGELIVDQRFDGSEGYVLDSLQGNRAIAGDQLETLKNSSFPHPYLNYKELGTSVRVSGKETVGGKEALVLIFDPAAGPEIRNYIDAQTMLPLRTVMTVAVPQLGQDVEQTTEFLDYKEVDGIKIPFRVRTSSSLQTITITLNEITHNAKVDESLFVKPAGR